MVASLKVHQRLFCSEILPSRPSAFVIILHDLPRLLSTLLSNTGTTWLREFGRQNVGNFLCIPTTANLIVKMLITYTILLLDTPRQLPVIRFNPVGGYMVLVY